MSFRRPSNAALVTFACALVAPAALAQRSATEQALERMEESLALREQDGVFSRDQLAPIVVVSTEPAYEESRPWYPTAAIAALSRVFGAASLRVCEACMAPQLRVEGGQIIENLGVVAVADVVTIDDGARGDAPPAKTGIWLNETARGVSLRIVDLRTSRVVYADNFDPALAEQRRTELNVRATRELERRARGDSITHVFVDAVVYPGQHLSMDYTDQWGDDNRNLSGVSMSLFDPLLGIGGCYYRIIPEALNIAIGGQILISMPTALVEQLTQQQVDLIDPLATAALVVRLPIFDTNYAIVGSASTNGRFGIGISLMNISMLPVIP
ncbi:MAG: hypothetical protein IT383_25475 [Deltaproteobacteria bacterium]|nr:hypothetical protein [Deltaproteobacteria bacterium]